MRMASQRGFTLIEMSVVLIIVGLLTGVVVLGRDLIRSAEVRAVAKQVDMLDSAILTFQVKYNCLPGDCPNASQFGFQSSIVIISQYRPYENSFDLASFLNPISSAYAAAPGSLGIIHADGSGHSFDPSSNTSVAEAFAYNRNSSGAVISEVEPQEVVEATVDGDGNGKIDGSEHNATASILDQANYVDPFNPVSNQIPAKLSGAYSPVTNQQGYFLINDAQPPASLSAYTLAKSGLYYYITGTSRFVMPAAAAMPAHSAMALDLKIDDGSPLIGRMQSSNNQKLDPSIGLIYIGNMTSAPGPNNTDCLVLNQKNEVMYNFNNENARCAVQIRASVGL